MKNVHLTYPNVGRRADPLERVPRGQILIAAALMSWLVVIGVGSAGVYLFQMIASHI